MKKIKFDDVRWHKDMHANIEVHTITRGIIRKNVTVVGVDFPSENIVLSDGDRYYHRKYNQITLTD